MNLLTKIRNRWCEAKVRREWVQTGRQQYTVLTVRYGHLTMRRETEYMDFLSGEFRWFAPAEYPVSWSDRAAKWMMGSHIWYERDVQPGLSYIIGTRSKVKLDG